MGESITFEIFSWQAAAYFLFCVSTFFLGAIAGKFLYLGDFSWKPHLFATKFKSLTFFRNFVNIFEPNPALKAGRTPPSVVREESRSNPKSKDAKNEG